jgi:hypothetical protein
MNSLHHTDVVIKIQVNCLVKEFDNLDEYVYSIRRPSEDNNYDYNDQFLMILKSNSVSYYRIAIKAPNHKQDVEINGNIVITCQ